MKTVKQMSIEIQESINKIERTAYYWLVFDTVVIISAAIFLIYSI